MPPTGLPLRCWDAFYLGEISQLPPGTTKLGNLRDGHNLSELQLLNQIFGILFLCVKPTQGYQKYDRVSCSGMLGELVGSYTKVVIYATYTICCERL